MSGLRHLLPDRRTAQDPLGRAVMGADLFGSFIELKSREWWNFHNSISNWEINEYLTKF